MNRVLTTLAVVAMGWTCRAAELGQRVIWDGARVPASGWQVADGITARAENGAITLVAGEVDYGWAAAEELLPFSAGTTVELAVTRVEQGQLSVQVEWFRADGSFIGATPLLERVKSETTVPARPITELVTEGEKPNKFRLKFWVEGKHCRVVIGRASAGVVRVWRKAGTRLVKSYDAGTTYTSDPGIRVEAREDDLHATLAPDVGYAAFVLEERVEFDPKAVVMVDLAGVQNGVVSVQALVWKADGTFLHSVDLLKDVSAAGCFEVPLEIHKDKLGADAAKLSFKVWLAGGQTTARLAGVRYGVLP
jgi:hypothetical protein